MTPNTNEGKKMKKSDIEQPTMMVSVGKTWGAAIVSEVTHKRVSLEDCVRGYWRLSNSKKCEKAVWIMGFVRGEIVGVWEIDREKGWMPCEKSPKKTWPEDLAKSLTAREIELRRVCELKPVDRKIWDKYVGMKIQEIDGMDARGGWCKYTFD